MTRQKEADWRFLFVVLVLFLLFENVDWPYLPLFSVFFSDLTHFRNYSTLHTGFVLFFGHIP